VPVWCSLAAGVAQGASTVLSIYPAGTYIVVPSTAVPIRSGSEVHFTLKCLSSLPVRFRLH
jgi:hypothetical protein